MGKWSIDAGQLDPSVASLAQLLTELIELEKQLTSGLVVALSEESTTFDEWRTMEALARLDGPTMGELAEATGLANATLSRTVDSLEDASTAYRLPTPADRRRIAVHLSDRGVQRMLRIRKIVRSWELAAERRVGSDVAAALLEATREAVRRLNPPSPTTAGS